MIDCDYLVLAPENSLNKPIPKNLIPCKCPDCRNNCYVAKSWIKKVQLNNPKAIVKCLYCIGRINWKKIEHDKRPR